MTCKSQFFIAFSWIDGGGGTIAGTVEAPRPGKRRERERGKKLECLCLSFWLKKKWKNQFQTINCQSRVKVLGKKEARLFSDEMLGGNSDWLHLPPLCISFLWVEVELLYFYTTRVRISLTLCLNNNSKVCGASRLVIFDFGIILYWFTKNLLSLNAVK